MSLKMHFLFLHLNFFPLNFGGVSDEHGRPLPSRYFGDGAQVQKEIRAAMLGDYCWMMKRDAPETKYHRQA
jgi:hypothetical protein